MKRSCGVILPITALPSTNGIGTLGWESRRFIDFLAAAEQSWWQILPAGPTSYGDSPYQSFSTFAGNPYFIDLDWLGDIGLLTREEIESVNWGEDPECVDYARIYKHRFEILKKAMVRGWDQNAARRRAFEEKNREWLPDYALYMALKRHFGMKAWIEWPDEQIRLREPRAMERYRQKLSEDIRLFTYIQYLFFDQWNALRAYAHERGIGIIGDLPIYVALDSADVWADPSCFQLDEQNIPKEVAGVPPDYFSKDGQLWGNPLYDWDYMRKDGYRWWLRRMAGAARLYDVLRIDHFRGLESYWAVPYGAKTAKNGRWVKGPGMDFLTVLVERFPDLEFIAEDLGFLTPEVQALLRDSGFPGMKVLEFAFDSREPSNYLPHTYDSHCVCYSGTHDNAPLMLWREEADPEDIEVARAYLGLNEEEGFHWGVLRGGMSSVAALFIAQMQDYLGLGCGTRMNTPGTLGQNWMWRMRSEQMNEELAQRMARMSRLYGRSSKSWPM